MEQICGPSDSALSALHEALELIQDQHHLEEFDSDSPEDYYLHMQEWQMGVDSFKEDFEEWKGEVPDYEQEELQLLHEMFGRYPCPFHIAEMAMRLYQRVFYCLEAKRMSAILQKK